MLYLKTWDNKNVYYKINNLGDNFKLKIYGE